MKKVLKHRREDVDVDVDGEEDGVISELVRRLTNLFLPHGTIRIRGFHN
jgi:hypothetical protein